MNSRRPQFHSIPLRTRRPVQAVQQPNPPTTGASRAHIASQKTQQWRDTEEEEDNPQYYPARVPNSALRYTDTQGNPVLQQGNKRYIIHNSKPQRKGHGLFLIGVGMLVMIALFVGGNGIVSAWNTHQLDSQYGFPRTFQVDVNVGHETGKSHFQFENLAGHIFFEEIPEGTDFKHAIVYPVTVLYGSNAANTPVTATFADVNHDGKTDVLIHIGDETTIIFLNTGNGFKPES